MSKTLGEMLEAIYDYCELIEDCDDCLIKDECDECDRDFQYHVDFIKDTYKQIKDDKEELVNHPNHYNFGNMETIDEMELIFGIEATMHFCLLNSWKYRARAVFKNKEQDIEKSNWYIKKYKKLKEKLDEQRFI